jgi:hypothetical protein
MTQEELNKEMNEAIVERNLQAIRILIKLGVDPNFRCIGEIIEDLGYPSWMAVQFKNITPLHVSGRDPSLVKMLIDAKPVLGGAIEIQSAIYPAANGLYSIYKLEYELSNRDTPFYWTARATQIGIGV